MNDVIRPEKIQARFINRCLLKGHFRNDLFREGFDIETFLIIEIKAGDVVCFSPIWYRAIREDPESLEEFLSFIKRHENDTLVMGVNLKNGKVELLGVDELIPINFLARVRQSDTNSRAA